MRNSGTYQLVSEHSILSARRKNGDAAGAPRTRSQRLEAFGECVRQIGATRKSHRRHDVNTTVTDFKVYDRGREKLEDANTRRRRSREDEIERHWDRRRQGETRRSGRRDEFLEKLEEIVEILRSSISNVAVKSSKPEERRETQELKKEHDEIEGCEPGNVIVKTEGDEIGGDIEPPREQSKIEAPREEGSPKEPTPVEGLTTEGSPVTANRLAALVLSLASEACEKEEWKVKAGSKSMPEEENRSGGDGKPTATTREEERWRRRELHAMRERNFSLVQRKRATGL